MKKTISYLIILVTFLSIVSGCANKQPFKNDSDSEISVLENGMYANLEFDKQSMVTLDGTEVSMKDDQKIYGELDFGFGFTYDQTFWKLKNEGNINGIANIPLSLILVYYPDNVLQLINKAAQNELSEEELGQLDVLLDTQSLPIVGIFRMPIDNTGYVEEFEFFSSFFETVEELVTFNDSTYYFAYSTDISALTLTDQEKVDVSNMISELGDFRNGILIFPDADTRNKPFEGQMNDFETQTLAGETVTQDIFKDYDLTMVNVWATWCGPCVEELPELSKLYDMLPENVNMITVCTDANEETELARQIYDSVQGRFEVLLMDERLEKSLGDQISTLPTTFFVDQNGIPQGSPVIIEPGEEGEMATAFLEAIMAELVKMGK